AVNKDEMNKVFFGGKGLPMHVNHFLPSRPGWNPEWEQKYAQAYGYNPEKAKQLLADAGQSNLKMSIFLLPVAGLSGGEDLAEAIGNYWRNVGVDVTLQQTDGTQLAPQLRAAAIDRAFAVRGTGSNQYTGTYAFNSGLALT